MSRLLLAALAMALLLPPDVASAASVQKRSAARWHGHGFLPGYRQPPNPNVPVYRSRSSLRSEPDFTPRYWYRGSWHYFGRPGFYRGQWNGGSFGPCWTRTPVGLVWNCG